MERTLTVISRDPAAIIALEDMKRDLDVTFNDDDTLIQGHIDQAVSWIEERTNRFLQPVVVEMVTGQLKPQLLLPYAPIRSVLSIAVDGVAVAGFRGLGGSPYTVLPPLSQSWPFTATGLGGSIIRFEAGYAAGEVPSGLMAAVKAVASIYYDKPSGAELTAQWDAAERALQPYKLVTC